MALHSLLENQTIVTIDSFETKPSIKLMENTPKTQLRFDIEASLRKEMKIYAIQHEFDLDDLTRSSLRKGFEVIKTNSLNITDEDQVVNSPERAID